MTLTANNDVQAASIGMIMMGVPSSKAVFTKSTSHMKFGRISAQGRIGKQKKISQRTGSDHPCPRNPFKSR